MKEESVPSSVEITEPSLKNSDIQALKDEIRNNILADIGRQSLAVTSVTNEVKEEIEHPRKIIYEIKGMISEDAMYNGNYVAGKSVGVGPFGLTQVPTNKNTSQDRENDNYITGLDIEEIEMDDTLSGEVKTQRMKDVISARKFLERRYSSSLDKKNHRFWGDLKVKINDLGLIYDTLGQYQSKNNDPLLLYYLILSGSFQDIARSYDECRRLGKMYYLTVREEEAKRNFAGNKAKIKAMSVLDDMINGTDGWSKESVLYMTYGLLARKQHGYTLNTPMEIMIGDLDDFINGVGIPMDKKLKPKEFLDAVNLHDEDKDRFRVKGLLEAALYYGFISTSSKKELVNRFTGFTYGSSKETAIDKLLSPKNIEEFAYIKNKVFEKWNS